MCDGDYTYWPYDQQKCRILLGSWSYTGEEIDFHLDEDGAREFLVAIIDLASVPPYDDYEKSKIMFKNQIVDRSFYYTRE